MRITAAAGAGEIGRARWLSQMPTKLAKHSVPGLHSILGSSVLASDQPGVGESLCSNLILMHMGISGSVAWACSGHMPMQPYGGEPYVRLSRDNADAMKGKKL